MISRQSLWIGVVAAVLLSAACDSVQLTAPTNSRIAVTAANVVLPNNGTTDVTAYVLEEAGTPVQNGTTVRFTTTLGRLDPIEVQTRNGYATTRFFADGSSGVAQVRAISGPATGGDSNANLVQITVGNAAVSTITVRANPGSVSANGSSVELIASVFAESGLPLENVQVIFSADQGLLGAATAVTNASGEARTTLTTSQQTVISATAGTKTSANVTIPVVPVPSVTITCAPAAGAGSCSALQANASNNLATVVFTVTKPAGSSALRTATLEFGDGTSQSLGNLAGGSTTVTHSYAGPGEGDSSKIYTATVNVVDVNNQTGSASAIVIVSPRTPINVSLSSVAETATAAGQRFTFTATVTGGGEGAGNAAIQTFTWDFGDGSGEVVTSGGTTAHVFTTEARFTVTVTARTADGRTAVGRTEVLVNLP